MEELDRESWLVAESPRVLKEREAMAGIAPDLRWCDEDPAGGWEGIVPVWPFERSAPPDLDAFLDGRRLEIRIQYLQSFPMVEPKFWPINPEPEIAHRTEARWHVLGDGALCLFQDASGWTGLETAADLIPKAAGWFLEFLLMRSGAIEEMTEEGIAFNPALDHLFVPPHDAEVDIDGSADG